MTINWIHIKGFRNFDDEIIHFAKQTLIVGANDIGKSNLLYALRILFDKSLSERDLELSDADYNAYTGANEIEITVELVDVYEPCLKSAFREAVENGRVYIQYKISKGETPVFLTGHSLELLEEKTSRFYTRFLNMEYVDTNRDLFNFIKREKSRLIDSAREQLNEGQTDKDNAKIARIQHKLDAINRQINSLNYIKRSLSEVNRSLSLLSAHNEDQEVRFVAGNSDVKRTLDNLSLSYSSIESPLSIGGDGRNNQIYLATWVAKQKISRAADHVTFFAIEEPEAHLHPHQQRKLSKYLLDNFEEQIFITTHSTHIAYSFTPEHIVRLYSKGKISYAAQGGCSHNTKIAFDDFGYRLNAISTEALFADGVLLVEGMSEVLFYKALASALKIDLDHYNISVLSVEGVGFKPYIKLCHALEIPCVMRTDNDIFSKTKKKKPFKYFAGITRAMGIYHETINTNDNDDIFMYYKENERFTEWRADAHPSDKAIVFLNQLISLLAPHNIFLSKVDLETDLVRSPLADSLKHFYKISDEAELIKKMKERKAENMLEYIAKKEKDLKILSGFEIVIPLTTLIAQVKKDVHPIG